MIFLCVIPTTSKIKIKIKIEDIFFKLNLPVQQVLNKMRTLIKMILFSKIKIFFMYNEYESFIKSYTILTWQVSACRVRLNTLFLCLWRCIKFMSDLSDVILLLYWMKFYYVGVPVMFMYLCGISLNMWYISIEPIH